MPGPPEFNIDFSSFNADPYPMLVVLRREAPVAFVPQLGSTLLTRLDDIAIWEKRIDVFSSHQPHGFANRLSGSQHDAQGRGTWLSARCSSKPFLRRP